MPGYLDHLTRVGIFDSDEAIERIFWRKKIYILEKNKENHSNRDKFFLTNVKILS